MFNKEKLIVIISGDYMYMYFCLPPYIPNFRYFEIKSSP